MLKNILIILATVYACYIQCLIALAVGMPAGGDGPAEKKSDPVERMTTDISGVATDPGFSSSHV
jgi:hypothetical protein